MLTFTFIQRAEFLFNVKKNDNKHFQILKQKLTLFFFFFLGLRVKKDTVDSQNEFFLHEKNIKGGFLKFKVLPPPY